MTREIEALVNASRDASNATTLHNMLGIFVGALALLVAALVIVGVIAYFIRVWRADATPSGNCPCCGRPYAPTKGDSKCG